MPVYDAGSDPALITSIADGANVTLGAKADAKSVATDTTPVSAMSVWKQISASIQAAAASLAATIGVTQSGTWTVQPGNTANTTAWKVDGSAVTQPSSQADGQHVTFGAKADAKSTATDATAVSAMSVWKQISASVQAIATSIAGTLTVATHAVTQSGLWNFGPRGGSCYRVTSVAATTNPTVIKASAGVLGSIMIGNSAGVTYYLKFYDKATAPTVGTDTPVRTVTIVSASLTREIITLGQAFNNGIAFAITTGIADNDTGAIGAGAVSGSIDYF
jgi:hypothetical protein